MKPSQNNCIRNLLLVLVISLTLIAFSACANVQHQATFNKNYLPKEDVRIQVAKVVNDTGYAFDVDIEQLLANTLEEQLMEENLLNLGKTKPNLFMETRIVGYKKGSAFKRWMMPGWGATELAIRCDLKDGNNNLVGTAMSSREIVAGGLYTVGAWETIFDDVANDVAVDLKHQIVAQGYVVKAKTQTQAAVGGKAIEPGAEASVRPKEVQELASTPETSQTKKAIDQPQEVPKLASLPQEAPIVQVSLRRRPMHISNQMQITDMLIEYDFYERTKNAHGAFENAFVDNNDGTVTDKATGLMWQKGGSSEFLDNRGAKKYVMKLNKQRFAGYRDWRMPTVEESASLLTRRRKNGVHIAPVFDYKQTRCWTIDPSDPNYQHLVGAWLIDFQNGAMSQAYWWKGRPDIGAYRQNPENYVKAVRSVK